MAKKERFKRIRKWTSRSGQYGRQVVNADQIQSEWANIKGMVDSLKPKKGEARQETFDNAMNRLNLSEKDLAGAYKFHVVRLYIFAAGLVIGVSSVFGFLFTGNWIAAVACFGFSTAMAALSFQSSFRSFQIKQRELVSVQYWAQHTSDWLPLSPNLPKAKKRSSHLPVKSDNNSRTRRK